MNFGAGFAFLTSFISTQPSCAHAARIPQINIDTTLGGTKGRCTFIYCFFKMINGHPQMTMWPQKCWLHILLAISLEKKALRPLCNYLSFLFVASINWNSKPLENKNTYDEEIKNLICWQFLKNTTALFWKGSFQTNVQLCWKFRHKAEDNVVWPPWQSLTVYLDAVSLIQLVEQLWIDEGRDLHPHLLSQQVEVQVCLSSTHSPHLFAVEVTEAQIHTRRHQKLKQHHFTEFVGGF